MKRLLKRKVEKSYLLLVGLVSVFLVVGYFSYAYFTVQTEKANVISIQAGTLSLASYENELYTYPDGKLESVIITVKNTYPIDIKFNMYARNLDSTVQVFYVTEGGYSAVPPRSGMILAKGATRSFKIVGYATDHNMRSTDIRFNVGLSTASLSWPSNATEIPVYNQVSEPILDENMIPVTWDASSKTWVSAEYDDSDWYGDYNKYKWPNAVNWPNAVVVKKEYRNIYSQAMPSGIPIPMDKIQTMWVWIPRFSYTVYKDSSGKYVGDRSHSGDYDSPSDMTGGAIDIQFKDINNSKNTDTGTGEYTSSSEPANWKTASAFTSTIQSNRALPGFWVGKFETGNSSNSSCVPDAAYKNGNLLIKPNVTSAGCLDMGDIESVADDLTSNDFNYGELKVIPMTDAQWNAVAYLSHSVYGRWGHPDSTGYITMIDINTSDITGQGYGGASYETVNGTRASTTGTIYGIYDMVGGKFEKVVGCDLGTNPFYKGWDSSSWVTYTTLYDRGVLRGGAAAPVTNDPMSIFSYTNTDDLCDRSYSPILCKVGAGSSSEEQNGFRLVLVPVGTF